MNGLQAKGSARGGKPWLAGTGIALAVIFGVFILPFFFAPAHPALSASYSSGFNNRVAVVAAGVLALVTLGLGWRTRVRTTTQSGAGIGRRALMAALGTCAVFTLGLGGLLTRALVAYNDNLYFLEFMDQVSRYHRHIYIDFSFLYGPLLLYFPLAFAWLLRPLHLSPQAVYYIALTVMQMLGLVLLYYTLNAQPLSRRSRIITFCIFTLAVLCPLLGLNYTLVRSLLPFATLLFLTRIRRPLLLAALLFPAELLQLALSPEMGVAFAAGGCFYALCRAFTTSRWYGLAALSPPLAAAAFLIVTGKAYLNSIAQFSGGALNLIVEPLPYILFFLFALVWLVPRWLGQLTRQSLTDAVPMLSLFVLSLALVPAALGRCDPLHVFFNGAGIYLLGVVAISSYAGRAGNWWLTGLALTVLWTQAVNTRIYLHPILHAIRVNLFFLPESKTSWSINFQQAAQQVPAGRVAVPFFIPYSLQLQLKQTGLYQPDRECYYIGVWDAAGETARIQRMNQGEWVIVSTRPLLSFETADSSRRILGLGFHYPDRHAPYVAGELVLTDLQQHWTRAFANADWILYRNPRVRP